MSARKALLALPLLALFATATGQAAPHSDAPVPAEGPKELKIAPTDAVSLAFEVLEARKYAVIHINEPDFGEPRKFLLRSDYYDPCADAIDFLIKTKAPIDNDLLRLAWKDPQLCVRYRAVRILTARGNSEVVPILNEMCARKDAEERYLAWMTYRDGIEEGKLKPPQNYTPILALYAREADEETHEGIEWFLGAAKAKAAVEPLSKAVKSSPGSAMAAISALGRIGDMPVIPVIIADFGKGPNNHYHMQALGWLASPKAVDFIIEHLDMYGAVEALYESKSEKALPALKEHLQKLKGKQNEADSDLYIAATRIAIIRLSNMDPREELLRIAEDRKEIPQARRDALEALHHYETTALASRILKIYTTDGVDHLERRYCIHLLKDSPLPGVTEAMIDHALEPEGKASSDGMWTDCPLLEALNKRLDTSFRHVDDMRAHLRNLRGKKRPK